MTDHEQSVKALAQKYAEMGIPPTLAVARAEQELAQRKRVAANVAKTRNQRNVGGLEIRAALEAK